MSTASHLFCNHCGAAHPLIARFCRVCGETLADDPGGVALVNAVEALSIPGTLLKQRYRIVKQVGAGGFGEVYQAEDTQFGARRVAVKEMSQRGLSAREILEASDAFKREAFMLAGLTHPNLPSIYDHFEENSRWYLVMSFIEGETLEDYLERSKDRRLSVEKALNIGMQVASVLSYLHTRKPAIIFRDLKPSNIMRIADGQLYLIDFGIARHFKQGQAKDTVVLGSPGYAAPEQYGRAQTTPQTDVYSLGALLHQLLSGHDPSLAPFIHPPLDAPIPPALNNLIMCMLDKDAKKRPASMANIKRELQRIMVGRSHGLVEQSPLNLVSMPSSSPPLRSPQPSFPSPKKPVPPQALCELRSQADLLKEIPLAPFPQMMQGRQVQLQMPPRNNPPGLQHYRNQSAQPVSKKVIVALMGGYAFIVGLIKPR